MGKFDKIIQQTTERLYEDERLRSNLTDDEAKIVLGWAENWIQSQVSAAKDDARAAQISQSEFARVRQTVGAMNALAAKPGTPSLSDAIAAVQPQVQKQSANPRADLFKMLTQFVNTMWRMQA